MRVLVIGLGGFGLWFSRTMLEMGHEVIAIDSDPTRVDRYAEWASRVAEGDATDPEVLRRAGAADADAAVIATADDLATTILSTVALRDLGVDTIHAVVDSTNEARALDALGLSGTSFPARESGVRLAHSIVSSRVLDYTPIGEERSLQEIEVPEAWRGKTVAELQEEEELEAVVVAVRDELSGAVALPPNPGARLKESDTVIVAGPDDVLKKLTGDDEE